MINTKKTMARHIIIKLLMSKDRRKSVKYPENKRHKTYCCLLLFVVVFVVVVESVTKSHVTLCDPMDCSLPGTSVPGII